MRTCFAAIAFTFFSTSFAHAVPILQVYLEGAVYDDATDTWVVTPAGSSGGAPFRLWTIGNISGPGGKGTIENVRLAAAFGESFAGSLSITLTPTKAGGSGTYGGTLWDPSLAPAATLNPTPNTSNGVSLTSLVTDGSIPVLSDGKILPSHGIYGSGTVWNEFLLGDFDTADSPIGDFIGDFPTDLTFGAGQINVYDVSVTGGSGATVHFDLYDSVQGENKARFAPFSHDADGESNIVPEPSTFVIWSFFAAVLIGCRRRRKHR